MLKKVLVTCLLCWFYVFFAHTPVFATPTHPSYTVKVGYVPGFGFVRDMDSLSRKGYLYDIFKRVEQYTPYRFVFVPFPDRDSLLAAVKSKAIHLGGPIIQTPDIIDKFSFSKNPLGKAQIVLTVADRKKSTYYNDPVFINGKTVASFHGSPFEEALNAYCERHDISVKYVRAPISEYHTLKTDFYLASTVFDVFQEHTSLLNLNHYDYFLLFHRDYTALNSILHAAYEETHTSDGKLLHELFLKYYNRPQLVRRHLTREEAHYLRGRHFVAGYLETHRPFEFTNKEGKADGIVVEFFNMLAKQYGFTISYKPYSLDNRESNSKHYDFLISIMGDRLQEGVSYRITESYLTVPLMLFTHKNKDMTFDHKGKNIAILRYLALDYNPIQKAFPEAQIISYNSFKEIFTDYKKGNIDALLATNTAMVYLDNLLGQRAYTFSTEFSVPLKLLISQKLPEKYVNLFNIIFDHVDQKALDEIIARHTLRYVPTYSFKELVHRYLWEIIIFILAFLALISISLLYMKNKKNKEMVTLMKYDKLTGFINYNYFSDQAKSILSTAKNNEYELVSIDIDNFKTIINYFSYAKGTEVLLTIANALKECLEEEQFLITRLQADNFLILRKQENAKNIIQVLYEHVLPKTRTVLQQGYDLHFSVGIYVVDNYEGALSILVDRANIARQKGKKEHETTCYTFDKTMQEEFNNKLNVTFRMEKALLNKEFKLIYQPKIDLQSLRVKGAEALVRWIPRGEPMIYPSTFIPIFEQNGFITKLDLYVFAEVCKFIKENSPKMDVPLISANLSACTMQEENLENILKSIAESFGVAPQRIELEITESAMVHDGAMEIVQSLKQIGFAISIDDFGAGASSLNRLGAVDAEVVKLDKAFLDYSSLHKRNEIVVKNTIIMANDLQMKTVAEGVETLNQARWLQNLGCHMVQGYYFEKPMPEEDFIHLLRTQKQYSLAED